MTAYIGSVYYDIGRIGYVPATAANAPSALQSAEAYVAECERVAGRAAHKDWATAHPGNFYAGMPGYDRATLIAEYTAVFNLDKAIKARDKVVAEQKAKKEADAVEVKRSAVRSAMAGVVRVDIYGYAVPIPTDKIDAIIAAAKS